MRVLVTGAVGMIGKSLVSALLQKGYEVVGVDISMNEDERIVHKSLDLNDLDGFKKIILDYKVERIIHLAALAHTSKKTRYTWEQYYNVNVECAKNVFEAAGEIPVLFISTVDVYGFFDGKDKVNSKTPIRPISNYGKSKAMAEAECKKLQYYDIFRFAPVYTNDIKRDIQKRYYLKYPNIAYKIGKGQEYEILNVDLAVQTMVNWCNKVPENCIHIIKDPKNMWTPDYIKAEKKVGRARCVLYVPRWMVRVGYASFKFIFGENELIYLLSKAANPLKSEQ